MRTIKKIASFVWEGGGPNVSKMDEKLVVRYYNNNNKLMTKVVDAYIVEDLSLEYVDVIDKGFEDGDFNLIDLLVEIMMSYHTMFILSYRNELSDDEFNSLWVKLGRLSDKHNLGI